MKVAHVTVIACFLSACDVPHDDQLLPQADEAEAFAGGVGEVVLIDRDPTSFEAVYSDDPSDVRFVGRVLDGERMLTAYASSGAVLMAYRASLDGFEIELLDGRFLRGDFQSGSTTTVGDAAGPNDPHLGLLRRSLLALSTFEHPQPLWTPYDGTSPHVLVSGSGPSAVGCEDLWVGCMVFAVIFAAFLIPACYDDFHSCAGYPHP